MSFVFTKSGFDNNCIKGKIDATPNISTVAINKISMSNINACFRSLLFNKSKICLIVFTIDF